MHKKENNYAFIDGQNLYFGTLESNWKIDYLKLRVYLKENYGTEKAYYFIGYKDANFNKLYTALKKAGFKLIFKVHNKDLTTKKKGNVDVDMVFEIMKHVVDNKTLSKIILISGDGDYKKLVNYLIGRNKFKKILFPNKKASSLYKNLGNKYFQYLDRKDIRKLIELEQNEKGA